MSWPLISAEIEERSTSEAATAVGSVADAAAAAASVGAAETTVEACSAGAEAAALVASGVAAAASAAEASLLPLPPQPHRESDLDDETPPRTIGAAAAYRVRNGDDAVVSPVLTFRNEVPNCRPWPNFRLERLTNRLCVCVQAPGEGRERAIPLLGSIATVCRGYIRMKAMRISNCCARLGNFSMWRMNLGPTPRHFAICR